MFSKTRSQKPTLSQGLERVGRRVGKAVDNKKEVPARVSSTTSETSEESIGGDTRRKLEETLDSKSDSGSGEEIEPTTLGIETLATQEELFVNIDLEDVDATDRHVDVDPTVEVVFQEMAVDRPPAIDPLVRPRGLPVAIPIGLLAASVPGNLSKFYGTKDEDPTLHVERYIEVLTSSLITNEGYYLVWFPGTLHGEAYNWYRDHDEGHFTTWTQLQVAFLNHFRPEVGQSTALRALSAVRQHRDEEMTNYIRRFELVCMRYVGGLLNDDTLRQFFIEGFVNRFTIKGVLERNPTSLEQAKAAARAVDVIERNYERLWRKEDESIPQFIPINPIATVAGSSFPSNTPVIRHIPVDLDVRPTATNAPVPLLALPEPQLEHRVEELEKRVQAGQQGFQDSVMKQIQALTEQMAFMVKNQNENSAPPRIESGNHYTGVWCTTCGQSGHSPPQCRVKLQGPPPAQPYQAPQGYGGDRGPQQQHEGYQGSNQGYGGGRRPRKVYHEVCRRWHEPGQCWNEGQPWPCGNCGGTHSTQDCRQPDKVIQLPPPVINPYQNARDNMRGQRRPHSDEWRGLRPPNLYYNYEGSRQNHQPPEGLQTQQGYMPILQNQHGGNQNYQHQRQGPPSNQDVRVAEEVRMSSPLPSHTNSTVIIEEQKAPSHLVTHKLKLDGNKDHRNATLAVITRSQVDKLLPVREITESSDSEGSLDLQALDEAAKEAAKVAKEAGVEQPGWESPRSANLECGEESEEMELSKEDWEGPGIPLEEFGVMNHRTLSPKTRTYDLWRDLHKMKVDITLAQLLEVSPLMRKNFKDGLPVAKRKRKVKSKLVARAEAGVKPFDVQAAEIEVEIVDKVIPNVLIDGGSGLNIMPFHTMEKLGLSLTGPSPFVLNMADQSPAKPVGQIKDCRMITGGVEYLVTFHVIKMFASKEAFPLLLGRPWLRMSNATVYWGGEKPTISYGPPTNSTKVRIKPVKTSEESRKMPSGSDLEFLFKEEVGSMRSEALVNHNNLEGSLKPLSCLGPNLYNWQDSGDYAEWLEQHPNSSSDREMDVNFLSLVNSEEGLVALVDIEEDVFVTELGGQDLDVVGGEKVIEGSLKFKTNSVGITVGEDVASYPNVPPDWYKGNSEQFHVTKEDWKYVTIKMEGEDDKQMRMGSSLSPDEVEAYSGLVREYREVFAWSYTELKGVPPEIVEHRIPLMPGAVPIRQKERRMNPQLQLVVKTELEKLLQANFIKPVEITDWVSPMVLVRKKNGKLRVCVDYRKLNTCTQKDHFPFPFIANILEEVVGYKHYTFMSGYSGFNQVSIAIADRHKTTFTMPWSTFVWPVVPFRLCNVRKVEFSSKFDVVWLGPYLVSEVFLNNSFQL